MNDATGTAGNAVVVVDDARMLVVIVVTTLVVVVAPGIVVVPVMLVDVDEDVERPPGTVVVVPIVLVEELPDGEPTTTKISFEGALVPHAFAPRSRAK